MNTTHNKVLKASAKAVLIPAAALSLFLLSSGCSKEEAVSPEPVVYEQPSIDFPFRPSIIPYKGADGDVATKSWASTYTEMDNLFVDESVAVYSKKTGQKVASYYYSDAAAQAGDYDTANPREYQKANSSPFVDGEEYTAYAIVNSRGDQTELFPSAESEVPNIIFRIDDPKQLSGYGIPMAGSASFIAETERNGAAFTTSVTIPVRRLFAKVHLTVPTFSYGRYGVNSFWTALSNINTRILPFGQSKALVGSDVMEGNANRATSRYETYGDITDTYFYVPENMQGIAPSIQSPALRNPGSSPSVRFGVMTFVEPVVGFNSASDTWHPIDGAISYKRWLGRNNTDDFNVEGNSVYNLSYTLNESGLFTPSNGYIWNGSTLTRYKYRLSIGLETYELWPGEQATIDVTLGVGEQAYTVIERQAWRYSGGSLIEETRAWEEVPSYWSNTIRYIATIATPREYNTHYTVQLNGYYIEGIASGYREFVYYIIKDGYEDISRTGWTINCNVVDTYSTKYRYVLYAQQNVLSVGSNTNIVVRRYSDYYVNGVLSTEGTTYEEMNSNLFNWSYPSIVTLSDNGTKLKKVTAVSAGTATITASLKSPTADDVNTTASVSINVAGWDDSWEDGGEIEL